MVTCDAELVEVIALPTDDYLENSVSTVETNGKGEFDPPTYGRFYLVE